MSSMSIVCWQYVLTAWMWTELFSNVYTSRCSNVIQCEINMKLSEMDQNVSNLNGEILYESMINHDLAFEDMTLKLGLLESSSGCSRFKNWFHIKST